MLTHEASFVKEELGYWVVVALVGIVVLAAVGLGFALLKAWTNKRWPP